jgi:hypothetical protein
MLPAGTMPERVATILLPNCPVRAGTRGDSEGVESVKCPTNQYFPGSQMIRTDTHERISSAVHSTTLPPLQAPMWGDSPRRGRGVF